jgi:hypothetical protein
MIKIIISLSLFLLQQITTRTETTSVAGKRTTQQHGNLMSMKYMSRKENKNNATRDESMECLQAQLSLENLKNKGGEHSRDKLVLSPTDLKQ